MKKYDGLFRFLGLAISFVLLFSCQEKDADSAEQGNVTLTRPWPGKKAYVCWLNEGFDEEKTLINSVVFREYNSRSNMKFLGFHNNSDVSNWRNCADTQWDKQNIKIRMYSTRGTQRGGSSYVGATNLLTHALASVYGRGATMNLVDCQGWADTLSQRQRENCIKFVALHEFGHAAGLLHEHQREDSTCQIEQQMPGSDTIYPPTTVGRYDADSVMNYCVRGIYPTSLPAGDIRSLEVLFGPYSANGINSAQTGNGTQTRRAAIEAWCKKAELTKCVVGGGGAACVTNFCKGGEYHCMNREKLEFCASKIQGGAACMNVSHGDCRG